MVLQIETVVSMTTANLRQWWFDLLHKKSNLNKLEANF